MLTRRSRHQQVELQLPEQELLLAHRVLEVPVAELRAERQELARELGPQAEPEGLLLAAKEPEGPEPPQVPQEQVQELQ